MNRVSKRLLSLLPCCMLFGPGSVQAVICKSIDAQGLVSYTDTPVSQCAQPVKLRGHSSYTPRPIERNVTNATISDGQNASDDKGFTGYVSLRIVQPTGGAVIHSNEGTVPVRITLQPALQKGHRIQLILDGQPVGSALESGDAVLSGIERGTHHLSAQVLDRTGDVRGSMNSIEFTLRPEIIQSEQ